MMQRTVAPMTKNQEATVYIGNLDERVTEAILWELLTQAGPVVHVHIPRDRISQQHQGYGFVELRSEEDADYASKILNQIKLYGKPLKVNKATADKRSADVGANLFIGNLAPEVDEKLLQDTFGAFGTVIDAKVARDSETGLARGFGFVNYDSFEAADAAIESMNGQFLCNKPITISYAFKKDSKTERHGTAAERLLAMQAKKAGLSVAPSNQPQGPPLQVPQMGQVPPPQMYPPMGYPQMPGMMGAYPPQMYPPPHAAPYGYHMPQPQPPHPYAYPPPPTQGQPPYGYQYPPPPNQ